MQFVTGEINFLQKRHGTASPAPFSNFPPPLIRSAQSSPSSQSSPRSQSSQSSPRSQSSQSALCALCALGERRLFCGAPLCRCPLFARGFSNAEGLFPRGRRKALPARGRAVPSRPGTGPPVAAGSRGPLKSSPCPLSERAVRRDRRSETPRDPSESFRRKRTLSPRTVFATGCSAHTRPRRRPGPATKRRGIREPGLHEAATLLWLSFQQRGNRQTGQRREMNRTGEGR